MNHPLMLHYRVKSLVLLPLRHVEKVCEDIGPEFFAQYYSCDLPTSVL